MTNAVEKMFNLALFEPKKYFPDHAVCPETFWSIICHLEKETGCQISIQKLSTQPNDSQIQIAREFNKAFSTLILANPLADLYKGKYPTSKSANRKLMKEFGEFDNSIKHLFQTALADLINHQVSSLTQETETGLPN